MVHISIIIVNWNGKKDTLACLSSLYKLEREDSKIDVIVVDNNSDDDSVSEISTKFPHVSVVVNPENLGFTGGNNKGIEIAKAKGAEYLWLLNNDTTVDPYALQELLKVAREDRVGIVGPKIYFYRGHEYHKSRYKENERGKVFWYAGGIVDWKNMYVSHRGVDEVDKGQYDKTEETPFVSGCSMFCTQSFIDTVGYLDNKYYLYLEDFDYCMKAKRAGFKLVYAPKSIIWHKNASSSGKPGSPLHEYYLTRNRILAAVSYAPVRTKTAVLRQSLFMLMHEKGIKRQAVADALQGRFGKQLIWEKTK